MSKIVTFNINDVKKKNDNSIIPSIQKQVELLNKLYLNNKDGECISLNNIIQKKIRGYKSQDIKRELYESTMFIKPDECIELLVVSKLKCAYCKSPVMLLYEKNRDPTQWTLDRIDNTIGHNNGNVCISCLSCNLRKGSIDTTRYNSGLKCKNIVKI